MIQRVLQDLREFPWQIWQLVQFVKCINILSNNIIMLDPERKQSALYGRASHQIRQIQYNCRQVAAMSKYLNTLPTEIASSEVNCRKIEIFKTQIKDKLKEFATSIDQIYKILDRKIILMLAELKKLQNKQEKSTQNNLCKKCANQPSLKPNEEEKLSQSDRLFSDTLNPRITHLEAKINQYQTNQSLLKNKIKDLKDKNQALLDQFNRLSTASNQKINELASKISRDSINSSRQYQNPPNHVSPASKAPILSLTPTKQKKLNGPSYQTEQFSYQLSNQGSYNSEPFIQQQKSKLLNFGCMPKRVTKIVSNPLGVSSASEPYQKLDRTDKNRRFDLLLNKLRNSQQESTDESHSQEVRLSNEPASVFSQNIVQRYQI